MRTFVAEFFFKYGIMREFIIADNQDISKAGMMFLLSRQKGCIRSFFKLTTTKLN